MRRWLLSLFILSSSVLRLDAMGWSSVNFDAETTAAIAGALGLEYLNEQSMTDSYNKILDHYTSAEIASAGIYAAKWAERSAMKNVGTFGSPQENYYYRRIYNLVSARIMPKIWSVAQLMVKHPDKALYWGPYLFKVTEEVKQLCLMFEMVVTNGKVTFNDGFLVFLSLDPTIRQLFDLSRLGDVDWKAVWKQLVSFGDGLTIQDLKDDLDNIVKAGGAIASAGSSVLSDTWSSGSKVSQVFKMKPGEILDLYDEFTGIYDTFSDPLAVKNLLMEKILTNDSNGVARLFTPDGYNVTSYISDYVEELKGRFYTQRWYIYRRDAGSEKVCSYSPPDDSESIINGPEWYRVGTSDANYRYTSADYENSLRNSESYAGWSREQCQSLSNNGDKYVYSFYNYLTSSRIYGSRSGITRSFAYAHYIDVYKTWNVTEEPYEELFDSRTMSENAFEAKFQGKLAEYNSQEDANGNSPNYRIGKGPKNYYQAADETKMKGVQSVSYTVNCSDGAKLGEGSFAWKENGDQGGCLDERSKDYAMETTLSGSPDLSTYDGMLSDLGSEATSLQQQINDLQSRNNELLRLISKASIEEATVYRSEYNSNLARIGNLETQLRSVRSRISEVQDVRQKLVDDYADEMDGTYRIPAVMHELETAYQVDWSDNGRWTGGCSEQVFVRHGHIPNLQGEVTFTARLTKTRDEKWFIIRYHRAILNVSWELTSSYESSNVVDVLDLDLATPEAERAEQVNRRLSEIQQEYPSCSVEINYAQQVPPSVEGDTDEFHLLWMSDRLRVARTVNQRLTRIYSELVMVEKFMQSRETLLYWLKNQVAPGVSREIHDAALRNSFNAWQEHARSISSTNNRTGL